MSHFLFAYSVAGSSAGASSIAGSDDSAGWLACLQEFNDTKLKSATDTSNKLNFFMFLIF